MVCQWIRNFFGISEQLACEYACVLFLLHARFEIHPRQQTFGFLTWKDLLFFAAIVMCHWVPQADEDELVGVALRKDGLWPTLCLLREEMKPVRMRLSSGLDLDPHFTSPLRDLKAHLINDQESVSSYNRNVMERIRPILSKQQIACVSERMDAMVQGVRARVECIGCYSVV